MNRRQFASLQLLMWVGPLLGLHRNSYAISFNDISNAEAAQGLKTALEKGASVAVKTLGQANGFMGNDKVRIPLPGYLQDAANLMRKFGQGAKLDELVLAMNQAAEAAVPMARDSLVNAVKTMNVQDAKKILGGGETAVTQFFADKTRQPLSQKFLPVVTMTTARVDLASKYNQIAGKAATMGLVKGDQTTIEQYVTAKTLDGLYFMIGEEEKKIRQDPVAAGSAVLKKVFGALKL
jgi:hypothetical protein